MGFWCSVSCCEYEITMFASLIKSSRGIKFRNALEATNYQAINTKKINVGEGEAILRPVEPPSIPLFHSSKSVKSTWLNGHSTLLLKSYSITFYRWSLRTNAKLFFHFAQHFQRNKLAQLMRECLGKVIYFWVRSPPATASNFTHPLGPSSEKQRPKN